VRRAGLDLAWTPGKDGQPGLGEYICDCCGHTHPGNPYKAREQKAKPSLSDYADSIKTQLLQEMQRGKLSQAHYEISLAELEHCDQLSDEGVAARFNQIDECYLSPDTVGEQAVELGIRWKIARGFLWERGLLYWSGEEPKT